jgi:hypothetical protein
MIKIIKKSKRFAGNNTKFVIEVLSIIIIAFAIIFLLKMYGHPNSYSDMDTVAKINGETVTVGEFNLLLSDNISSTFTYIHNKYAANDSNDFWEKNFNGEVPKEIAKQKTMEKLIKIKIEQILMKKYGILDDIGYSRFLQDFENENKERMERINKNQVIFGPKQFQVKMYYDYTQNNMCLELKKKLGEKEFKLGSEELKAYYEKIKTADSAFKNIDFEKAKNVAQLKYIDEKYNEIIEKLVKDARVEINNNVYSRIKVRQY